MHLTLAQRATLKTDILANGDTLAAYNAGDLQTLANLYNSIASPNFTVWKSNVPVEKIGDNIVGTELAGLTALNISRLTVIVQLSPNGINASLTDRRAFFDDVFSGAGGVQTRAKLLILWKRLAIRIEKLFAIGIGSDASPATMVVENIIDYTEFIGL